jgi:hypothetical protein
MPLAEGMSNVNNSDANNEFIDAYRQKLNKANDKAQALEELLEAAKTCYEMEYLRYIEDDIPTSEWMADLFNAIVKYEEVAK